MTRQEPGRKEPAASAVSAALTSEQVTRWAERIADGRDSFPSHLHHDDCERLAKAVRERLRVKLVHLIARAIAARLHRSAGPDTEVQKHAKS